MGVTCIIGVYNIYIVCSTSVLYEEVTVRNDTVGRLGCMYLVCRLENDNHGKTINE